MNEIRPTLGIEFNDKYLEAKNKFSAFINALNDLTPEQQQQLAIELIEAMGLTAAFEQFIKYFNNAGK